MDGEILPLPPTSAPPGVSHVYVINSDEVFLETIGSLLEDSSGQVQVTLEQMRPNIEVTLENLRLAKPDLLILDLVPHRRDAQLLLEHMLIHNELKTIPVLAASTNPGLAEQVRRAYRPLVRDVLAKPFDLDVFFATLARLRVPIQVL